MQLRTPIARVGGTDGGPTAFESWKSILKLPCARTRHQKGGEIVHDFGQRVGLGLDAVEEGRPLLNHARIFDKGAGPNQAILPQSRYRAA
jgi:hypothetical protein